MKRLLVFIGLLSLFLLSNGQTDRVFWFAAPDFDANHGNNGIPLYLHISAVYGTTVTISRPADPTFTPVVFSLVQGEVRSFNMLTDFPSISTVNDVECYPGSVEDKGFMITADPGEITAFYEANHTNNRDIFSLKGKNALGKEFTITTQPIFDNGNTTTYVNARAGFVIVATENNTTVTVELNDDYQFHTAGTHIITLNRGETYVFESIDRLASRHPKGVKVTSNRNIAITLHDDSMCRNSTYGTGTCLDTFGDQTIPESMLGKEYIVMKGQLTTRAEFIIITAVTDGTSVTIDGVNVTTLDEGDIYSYQLSNRLTYVNVSNPAYVNHISGFGCEQGGAVLPSVDNCTGSYDVTFARSGPPERFYLNIMVRNDTVDGSPTKNQAVNNFSLEVNGVSMPIPASYFTYTTDSAFAYLIDDGWPGTVNNFFNTNIPSPATMTSVPQVAIVRNSLARFHLGVINGGSTTGCKYGYFSDYAANNSNAGLGGATAPTLNVYCNLDPIRLVATGGRSYDWSCTSHPYLNNNITNRKIADPYFYPDTLTPGSYLFEVEVHGECYDTTIMLNPVVILGPTSDFTISETEGCSPFTTTIKNTTNTAFANNMEWYFSGSKTPVNQTTLPFSFNRTFTNTSDTIQTHSIKLYSTAIFGTCGNIKERFIKVKPQVEASFNPDTTGCHPLPVTFNNTSTGQLDSTSYFWNFGDNTQSFDSLPTHTFYNYTLAPKTFTTRLVVESPLNCRDTAYRTIQVYPRIHADFVTDTNFGCSPLTVELNPQSSFGTDTLKWNIDYFYGDSSNTALTKAPVYISHRDTSLTTGPDTLLVSLIGINDYGCSDTSNTRAIVVYPEIHSILSVNDDDVCDSVPIIFTNLSQGNSLKYEWDFGDNTYFYDNTKASHGKTYLNRTNTDKQYHVSLKAISNYMCESTSDTVITVHPYLNANFGISYQNNCSPLNTALFNTGVGVDNYVWNMGDGTIFSSNKDTIYHTFINTQVNSDTTFFIKLTGTNLEGCKDSITRSVMLFPPVIADFDINNNTGCAPFNITINNNSTGGSLTYTWDFGDNISSSNPNPSFNKTYNNYTSSDQVYTINLNAKNAVGCEDDTSLNVTVFAQIDAEFTLPVTDSCPPLTTQLTNLSSAGSNITKWFIDNSLYSTDWEPAIMPSFNNSSGIVDTFQIKLVTYGAEDVQHYACSDTFSIPVIIYPELNSGFTMDKTTSCQPFVSNIMNTSNPMSGSLFNWYIDDDYYASGQNPPGLTIKNNTPIDQLHSIWLYGTTQYGCTDTAKVDITVHSFVNAYFTLNRPAFCSGDSVQVDRTGSNGGISSYSWDFNGELTSNSANNLFYLSYDNLTGSVPVSKYISLTVENPAGCDSTWIENVTVYPKVTADFTPDLNQVCYPHKTQFTNNSVNASVYSWDFGDGTSSTIAAPSLVYNNFSNTVNQTYTIQLISKSIYQCMDSISKQVTIFAKPKADFDFPISVSCPPFLAQMNNNSVGAALNYNWDFAGEGSSPVEHASYTFNNTGSTIVEKPVTLIVTSAENCKDTLEKRLSVYPQVDVDFTASDYNGCSPLQVQFTDTTRNALQIFWDINDEPFSTISDPAYRFVNETPGDKTVTVRLVGLSIYDCNDTAVADITINPTPVADFIATPSPADYDINLDQTAITFYNETTFQNTWDYEWNYGDGTTNNEGAQSFGYTYGDFFWGDITNNNKVPIRLVAWNASNPDCRDTIKHDIIINPPMPQVYLEDNVEGCVPYTINFNAATKYIYEDSYDWNFDESGAGSIESSPTYTYTEPGVYTVKLIVEGDGGINWDYKIITVHPKPEVDFAFSDTLVYISSQSREDELIDFYNFTSYGNTFRWYFNSGDAFANNYFGDTILADSYLKEPQWYYADTGTFFITLVAESNEGCFDTLTHSHTIKVIGEGMLRFPNTFFVHPTQSPSDEFNSNQATPNFYLFYPRTEGVEDYNLEIYDRWGTLVFKSNDVNRGWNGTIDGIQAKQGVYVWRCRGRYTTGQKFDLHGDVTLVTAPVEVESRY